MAQLGIGDYLKEAFKVPYNVILFVGGLLAGIVSLQPQIVWPLVVAAEIAYLATLATRPRFQNVVRAKREARRVADATADLVPRLLASLSPERRRRFEQVQLRCRDLQRSVGGQEPSEVVGILEGQQAQGVNKLLWVFLRTLAQEQSLANFCEAMPRQEIDATLRETRRILEQPGLPESMQEAHRENAQVLELRLENLGQAEQNLQAIGARLVRVENSILLIQEQALTRRDPAFVEAEVRSVTEGLQSVQELMRSMNLPQLDPVAEDATPDFLRGGPTREEQTQ